ncbi:hypothetical protein TrST_g8090 [Triparma strigata]|uniref:Ion transport domain-containing protein n=1 Tax=Triparma strigata TaxID=1606541 RepID=A0A9W7DSU5_9STRA|nr:hypothetical protein TrST_g8090 [Triparma strigata]
MIGFAFAFYVLYQGKADYDGIQHRSPFLSLFSSYALLLGNFDVNELEESSSFVITVFLFVGFSFFINIIMLNLLIAIMGDIFDRIQENAVAEFLFARANILLEIEATFGEKEKTKTEWYSRWLQVLVATTEGNEGTTGWIGPGGEKKSKKESDKMQKLLCDKFEISVN